MEVVRIGLLKRRGKRRMAAKETRVRTNCVRADIISSTYPVGFFVVRAKGDNFVLLSVKGTVSICLRIRKV